MSKRRRPQADQEKEAIMRAGLGGSQVSKSRILPGEQEQEAVK